MLKDQILLFNSIIQYKNCRNQVCWGRAPTDPTRIPLSLSGGCAVASWAKRITICFLFFEKPQYKITRVSQFFPFFWEASVKNQDKTNYHVRIRLYFKKLFKFNNTHYFLCSCAIQKFYLYSLFCIIFPFQNLAVASPWVKSFIRACSRGFTTV